MIKHYVVEGMTGENCRVSVEDEINELPGTQGVEVDLETGNVTVTGEVFTDADIIRAVENAGFTVQEDPDVAGP